jgi:hypothetical protein
MAIAPGTYDMTIQRRSDHSVNFELKDSDGSAVNLTGSTLSSQVWDASRTAKAGDVTITVTNTTGGLFTWKVTDTQTTTFTGEEYKYDILLTNSSGDKEYWVEGTIYMSEGYTA